MLKVLSNRQKHESDEQKLYDGGTLYFKELIQADPPTTAEDRLLQA